MPHLNPDIKISVRSSLQYDYAPSSSSLSQLAAIEAKANGETKQSPSGDLSAGQSGGNQLATSLVTTLRADSSINVYIGQSNRIIALRSSSAATASARPLWDSFIIPLSPGGSFVGPLMAMTIRLPSDGSNSNLPFKEVDLLVGATQIGDIWLLRLDSNFNNGVYNWESLGRPIGWLDGFKFLHKGSPGLGVNDAPGIDKGFYLLAYKNYSDIPGRYDPGRSTVSVYDSETKVWTDDNDVLLNNLGLRAIEADTALGSPFHGTDFGYLLAGKCYGSDGKDGIVKLVREGKTCSMTNIIEGTYMALSHVDLPFQGSRPLVFAIGDDNVGYCIKFTNGRHTKEPLFDRKNLTTLHAELRTSADVTNSKIYWIEVFALPSFGKSFFHLESKVFDETAVEDNGNLNFPGWGGWSAFADAPQHHHFAPTSDRLVALTCIDDSGNVTQMIQDPDTSDWIINKIDVAGTYGAGYRATSGSRAALSREAEQLEKVRTYYTEITVSDENMVPLAGTGYRLLGSQYAKIQVNGEPVTIDPLSSTPHKRAVTNAMGKICLSFEVKNTLSVPTFSLWTEGMHVSHLVDIHPFGDIAKDFKKLDTTAFATALREARSKENGNKVLPDGADADKLAKQLGSLMKVTDPTTHWDWDDDDDWDQESSRTYLHHSTPSELAITRRTAHLPTGYLRCRSSAKQRTPEEASEDDDGPPWGDFFKNLREGKYTIIDVDINPLNTLAKIKYRVEGVVKTFAKIPRYISQALDVAITAFEDVGCLFENVFGWLMCLLDRSAITSTANQLKNYLTNFEGSASWWLENKLKNVDEEFFNDTYNKMESQFASVKSDLGNKKIGHYDKLPPNPDSSGPHSPLATDPVPSIQEYLANIPSTAMWLSNKFFAFMDSTILDIDITPLANGAGQFDAFEESTRNFRTEFLAQGGDENLLDSFANLFGSFGLREKMGLTTFGKVLDALKLVAEAMLNVLKGNGKAAASKIIASFINMGKELLKVYKSLFSTSITEGLLASLFRTVTGVEPSLDNIICYLLAVPCNFLYLLVYGTPSSQSSNFTFERIWSIDFEWTAQKLRSLLAIVYVPIDITIDAIGVWRDVTSITIPREPISDRIKQIANLLGLGYSILDLGIRGFDKASTLNINGWDEAAMSCSLIVILYSGWVFYKNRLVKGPRADLEGQLVLFGSGLFAVVMTGGYLIGVGGFTEKNTFGIMSRFLKPVSSVCKPLRFFCQRASTGSFAAAAGGTLLVIDAVSSGGAAACLVKASWLE